MCFSEKFYFPGIIRFTKLNGLAMKSKYLYFLNIVSDSNYIELIRSKGIRKSFEKRIVSEKDGIFFFLCRRYQPKTVM